MAAFVTYFIVGAIVSKFKMNKSGLDIIPNKLFWKDLPFLLKVFNKNYLYKVTIKRIVFNFAGWVAVCTKVFSLCWKLDKRTVYKQEVLLNMRLSQLLLSYRCNTHDYEAIESTNINAWS